MQCHIYSIAYSPYKCSLISSLINIFYSAVKWASQLWAGKVFYRAIQQHFLLEKCITNWSSESFWWRKDDGACKPFPSGDTFFFFSYAISKKKLLKAVGKKSYLISTEKKPFIMSQKKTKR